jgi:tetratricopeptide (TPR) repeat protein
MISIVLHGLLLIGSGWITMSHTVKPKEEQFVEIELSDAVNTLDAVPNEPMESEAAVSAAESTQQDKTTQELQPQTEKKKGDTLPGPSNISVSGKEGPAQMLSHYSKEQLNLTLAQYNQALTLEPHSAFTYSNRGQVYYDKGEFDKAFSDFTQALTINSSLASARVGRGFIFIKKDQWDLASADFNQAVLSAPQEALGYYGRALCFLKNSDKQKAANDFRSFIQYAKPEHDHLVQIAHQILSELGKT